MEKITEQLAQSAQLKKNGNNSIESQNEQLKIAGMTFSKPIYDRSFEKHLDIPSELLNNQLVYRWVNEDNLPKYERLGYQLVPKSHFGENAISVRRYVGRKADGKEQYQILLAMPKAYYEERTREKARSNQESIKNTSDGSNVGFEQGKEYVKQFKIE